MGEYYQITDGEWIRPRKKKHRHQCCGCGLVHDQEYRIEDGRIEYRVFRNDRATAAVRRKFPQDVRNLLRDLLKMHDESVEDQVADIPLPK